MGDKKERNSGASIDRLASKWINQHHDMSCAREKVKDEDARRRAGESEREMELRPSSSIDPRHGSTGGTILANDTSALVVGCCVE